MLCCSIGLYYAQYVRIKILNKIINKYLLYKIEISKKCNSTYIYQHIGILVNSKQYFIRNGLANCFRTYFIGNILYLLTSDV